jgi:hypothetical protein
MRAQNLATLEPVGLERPFPPKSGIPFWPVHVAKESCVALVVIGVLVTLSVVSPWEIGEPANPLETPEAVKPEWYFLSTYQLLKYFTGATGKLVGILVSTIPFILLFLWPFLDRSPARHPRDRPIATAVGIIGIVLALLLGIVGHLSESHHSFFGIDVEFDVYGVPRFIGSDKPDDHEANLIPQGPRWSPTAPTPSAKGINAKFRIPSATARPGETVHPFAGMGSFETTSVSHRLLAFWNGETRSQSVQGAPIPSSGKLT